MKLYVETGLIGQYLYVCLRWTFVFSCFPLSSPLPVLFWKLCSSLAWLPVFVLFPTPVIVCPSSSHVFHLCSIIPASPVYISLSASLGQFVVFLSPSCFPVYVFLVDLVILSPCSVFSSVQCFSSLFAVRTFAIIKGRLSFTLLERVGSTCTRFIGKFPDTSIQMIRITGILWWYGENIFNTCLIYKNIQEFTFTYKWKCEKQSKACKLVQAVKSKCRK